MTVSAEQIQRLLDLEEIKQLKARYCRFVDTHDWPAYRGLLTDDYVFDHDGGFEHTADDAVAMVVRALDDAVTVHHVHSPEITFTGPDTASGIWAMHDYCTWPGEQAFVLRGWGYYHEEYVRTPDGWRLRRCTEQRLRVDTEGPMPAKFTGRHALDDVLSREEHAATVRSFVDDPDLGTT